MAWKKSSEAVVARFVGALPGEALGGRRKMFGYEACFVNGSFWTGLYQDDVLLKLPDEVKAQLPELKTAKNFDPMGGRPMKAWWVLPARISKSAKALSALLATTYGPVSAAPAPKKKKKPAKATQKKVKAKR